MQFFTMCLDMLTKYLNVILLNNNLSNQWIYKQMMLDFFWI